MLDLYQQLKSQVEAIEDDLRKAAGGNKAAGTRVRKSLQEVKSTAQDLRKRVLEDRDASTDSGSSF
ncbi:MAG: histone H1 [Phycisphaeraceae bacterium]